MASLTVKNVVQDELEEGRSQVPVRYKWWQARKWSPRKSYNGTLHILHSEQQKNVLRDVAYHKKKI